MEKITLLKGFRDFYPEDQAFQNWLIQNIKEVSESFGYQAYDSPIVEPLDLYAAKSGQELVNKQAFCWEDKTGNTLTLRPEITPSLARMISQKESSLTYPIKWYTYGPRFRYEQPQRGRGREFRQWDIDILGSDSVTADAEIITIAATFFQKIGLSSNKVRIKINDRLFLQELLNKIGIEEEKIPPVIRIIDKKDKVDRAIFKGMLKDYGFSDIVINKLEDLFDNKEAYKESPWLKELFDLLKEYEISDYIEYNPSIVRGLDYYTRTVFEGWDIRGKFRAIWGGGRYDNLTQNVGGKLKISGVGFAMGDMVIEEILRLNDKYPILSVNKTQVLVTIFSPKLFNSSLSLSRTLRQEGLSVELYPDFETRLDKQLKYADKKNIPYIIILGPEEITQNLITLKNLKTKKQSSLPLNEVIELLKKK